MYIKLIIYVCWIYLFMYTFMHYIYIFIVVIVKESNYRPKEPSRINRQLHILNFWLYLEHKVVKDISSN